MKRYQQLKIGLGVIFILAYIVPIKLSNNAIPSPQFSMFNDVQFTADHLTNNVVLRVYLFGSYPSTNDPLNDPIVYACNDLPNEWLVHFTENQSQMLLYCNWGTERLKEFARNNSYKDRLKANTGLPTAPAILRIENNTIIGCFGTYSWNSVFGLSYRTHPKFLDINDVVSLDYASKRSGAMEEIMVPDDYRYYLLTEDPGQSSFTAMVSPVEAQQAGWKEFFIIENPFYVNASKNQKASQK